MDEDTTDIGRLWQDALDRYCKDIGTNAAQYLPQTKWSISAIVADQQRQVETFNKYRHNKGLTDRFRSVISKNSDVIQSVADNVANAASSVRSFLAIGMIWKILTLDIIRHSPLVRRY
jgi:hypothetical protein